jgi:hypothetical protein
MSRAIKATKNLNNIRARKRPFRILALCHMSQTSNFEVVRQLLRLDRCQVIHKTMTDDTCAMTYDTGSLTDDTW